MKVSLLHAIQDAANQALPDSTDGIVHTAYDSLWTGADIPTQTPSALEQIMLADDKIFVVLAVVMIIWIGIIILVMRTDKHLKSVERSVAENIPNQDDGL
jgi:hypothetical protein